MLFGQSSIFICRLLIFTANNYCKYVFNNDFISLLDNCFDYGILDRIDH